LRKTHDVRDLRKHFLHKGKALEESSREISARIARRREGAHAQVLKGVAVSLKDLQPKRILDVGTGYGLNLTFLARRFGKSSRIWSIDSSPAVVREIKKRVRKRRYSRQVVVKMADAEQLPFEDDYFDLVVSLFSLHHLSQPKRGLIEMGRALSRGGKLIIADWTPAAATSLMLHAKSDMPSPDFVFKQLDGSGYRTSIRVRYYWYMIEAMK